MHLVELGPPKAANIKLFKQIMNEKISEGGHISENMLTCYGPLCTRCDLTLCKKKRAMYCVTIANSLQLFSLFRILVYSYALCNVCFYVENKSLCRWDQPGVSEMHYDISYSCILLKLKTTFSIFSIQQSTMWF